MAGSGRGGGVAAPREGTSDGGRGFEGRHDGQLGVE
jgi:hypothetical protein